MLEDDPDDRFLTKETLDKLGYNISIAFVQYSHDLFKHLEAYEVPEIILLDFNSLPENAIKILKKLKVDVRYKRIPVVVLGDSSVLSYISECYELGANSFIKKPSTMEETLFKIDTFCKYWFSTVESPVEP
jgi:response regulator RpfG family c-di-GMP phosphodiesterase